MRLSGTVTEIWRLEYNGVASLTLGPRDVISHVIVGLPGVEFLWVVHSGHASIWRRYRDMAPQR